MVNVTFLNFTGSRPLSMHILAWAIIHFSILLRGIPISREICQLSAYELMRTLCYFSAYFERYSAVTKF
jgi:hypothetical protein